MADFYGGFHARKVANVLDDLISKAAKAGELTHLSLIPSWGKGGAVTWRASRSFAAGGHAFGEAADPVSALLTCLKTKPEAPRKAAKAKPDPDFG